MLVSLPPDHYPFFADDQDYNGLRPALEQSIAYLDKLPADTVYSLDNKTWTSGDLIRTHRAFLSLLDESPSPHLLNQKIRNRFSVLQASGVSGINPNHNMLVTGYYQPVFAGSLTKNTTFRFPLYSIPNDLVIRKAKKNGGGDDIGRLQGSRFLPYWTRREIEQKKVLAGQELVWLKDPFDVFMLHIQGSGLITFPDGTARGVHFARKNAHPYTSIGKYMVDTGRLPLAMASMKNIRKYIEEHPEEREQILHQNASYIFFHWADSHGAVGSLGKELTAGRSIAADKTCFPQGALGYLVTRQADFKNNRFVSWKTLNRFVTIQDTGSAIKGPGRIDLFWGAGKTAGMAAGRMKEPGQFYILLLRDTRQ